MEARAHHRPVEEVLADIQKELQPVKEKAFLVHSMRLIIELEFRYTSSLYEHLMSPMKQTLYLIDVYYSIGNREETVDMDDDRWERIAILLNEIEMTYMVNVGFPNNGDIFHDERDEKISVALSTFLGYFGNACMSYEEQTRDRILSYLKPYDQYIQTRYGFNVDEALVFISHIRELNNDKLNKVFHTFADNYQYYSQNPEEWSKLTQTFIDRGVLDPEEWCKQPDLAGLFSSMTTNPGEIFLHAKDEILNVNLNEEIKHNLLSFFSYDKDFLKGNTVYYAEKRYSETHPLINCGDYYVCTINKFLLESLLFRVDRDLMEDKTLKVKYKQEKDRSFENKVVELFTDFFPRKTKIFSRYSIDGISENDLLVIIGSTCIVVEMKNCGFREPFRDPLKAYDRIKRDYSNAIQWGYEQCKRVEDILLSGNDVAIRDASNRKLLYNLKSNKIGDVWKIVVTDFKYGAIQTDLSSLLKISTDDLYPWSVCVDDLEDFLLLLRKLYKSIAPSRFIEFLDYREMLHGHVLCFDELEICGWYLNDREQFKEYAGNELIISLPPYMSSIFDAYYRIGLGFKDEFDINYKKDYPMPDYPRKIDLNIVSVVDVIKHSL